MSAVDGGSIIPVWQVWRVSAGFTSGTTITVPEGVVEVRSTNTSVPPVLFLLQYLQIHSYNGPPHLRIYRMMAETLCHQHNGIHCT